MSFSTIWLYSLIRDNKEPCAYCFEGRNLSIVVTTYSKQIVIDCNVVNFNSWWFGHSIKYL